MMKNSSYARDSIAILDAIESGHESIREIRDATGLSFGRVMDILTQHSLIQSVKNTSSGN